MEYFRIFVDNIDTRPHIIFVHHHNDSTKYLFAALTVFKDNNHLNELVPLVEAYNAAQNRLTSLRDQQAPDATQVATGGGSSSSGG
jgi:hypothetical protein